MSKQFNPKTTLSFPNRWALDSFLLMLQRYSEGWELKASSDNQHFRAKPKGSDEAILIGLSKGGESVTGIIEIFLNGEKITGDSDESWKVIFEHARHYRM